MDQQRRPGAAGPRQGDRSSPFGRGAGPGAGRGPGRGGGRGGDRDGRDGRRGGGRGKGGDRREGGGAAYRVINELGGLEKALGKADLDGQRASLEQIFGALRPLRLRSLDGLELNARGRLITTLFRVVRQPKPAASASPAAAEAAPVAEAAAPAGDAAPAEAVAPAEGAAPAEAVAPAEGAAPAEALAPAEGAAPAEALAPAEEAPAPVQAEAPAGAAAPAPVDPKVKAYGDVMYLVGNIWRAVGDSERAQAAFALSGRAAPTDASEPAAAEAPAEGAPAEGGRAPRGRGERGEKGDKGEGASRDWKEQAQFFELKGRTRDAAKLYEKHESWADAARLYEAGGEPRNALRNALSGKLNELALKLMGLIRAEDVPGILEKAGAWELLMEWQLKRGDLEGVARLYERARQFDQAALAWERAGKLGAARKAYEKANDAAGVARLRDLEVQKLVERGDRLGAATLLLQFGRKDDAVAAIEGAGGPRAYRFLLKLKLVDEAQAFARKNLEKAEADKDLPEKAKWLDVQGDLEGAARAWLEAGRKDRAVPLYEKLGDVRGAARLAEEAGLLDQAEALYRKLKDTANAERVAALPRPSPAQGEPPAEPGDTSPQTP